MKGKIMFITDHNGNAIDKENWKKEIFFANIDEGFPAYFSYIDDGKELKTIITAPVMIIMQDLTSIQVKTQKEVFHIIKIE